MRVDGEHKELPIVSANANASAMQYTEDIVHKATQKTRKIISSPNKQLCFLFLSHMLLLFMYFMSKLFKL